MTNDLRLQLLTGVPQFINGIGNVYPLKIKEISVFGEEKYNRCLSVLTATLNDLELELEENSEVKYFDYLIASCKQNKELQRDLEEILSLFFHEKICLLEEYGIFLIGELENISNNIKATDIRAIHRNNFDDLVEVICSQSGIQKKAQPQKKKKVNKKIAELQKKRARGQKLLAEARGANISLADIVSVLSVLYQDLEKVLNFTVFQLNDQYERFMRKERYENEFAMYLAGADSKDLDLKNHWSNRKVEKLDQPPLTNK